MKENKGECKRKDNFIIVRGKSPKAAGVKGAYLFLIQEEKSSRDIKGIYPVFVDGEGIKANEYYGLRGGKICRRKS